MTLPTDLPREVADRAEQPGFAVVLDRAGRARRRRRTTLASGLVAACVVGGVAWGAVGGGPGGRSPEPAEPGVDEPWDVTSEVDTRLPTSVQSVLGDKHAHIWDVAGSGDALAVVWRACADGSGCRYALVVRDGDDVTGRRIDTDGLRLDPVPGGWLLADAGGTELVSPDGDTEPVVVPAPGSSDTLPGDAVVDTPDGVRILRGTKVIGVPAPDGGTVVGGYVTPEGRLVVAAQSGASLSVQASDDGRTWEREVTPRSSEPVSGAVVAGSGDTVAVAFLGDDPDGSIPLVEVQVSQDAGRTWIPAHGLEMLGGLRVHDLTSLVVAPAGSTYVTTMSHGLVRIDAQANALLARQSAYDQAVVVVGDAVCVVAEAGRTDELRCSTDDGDTWAPQPLPGFR